MSGFIKKTTKERFREKVGLDWQWRAGKDKDGYGTMMVGSRLLKAHRLSYQIHNGEIPGGMCVLHSCDDPGCVFPEHLHLGTHKDNAIEREYRGRSRDQRGEKHSLTKLTDSQVLKIREEHAQGKSWLKLAKENNIAASTVGLIVNRITWTHI